MTDQTLRFFFFQLEEQDQILPEKTVSLATVLGDVRCMLGVRAVWEGGWESKGMGASR